jgi:hypothetical protein
MIRHCVEESNVDENMNIIDPIKVRHVTVAGGKITSMSGLIDPVSHLNFDFPDHRVTTCIIATAFEIGASVRMDEDGLIFANVQRNSFQNYGKLDYTQRLVDMVKAVKRRNQELRARGNQNTNSVRDT